MRSRLRYPIIGLAAVALYAAAGVLLRGSPLALSVLGSAALILSASLAVLAIWWRRSSWNGCQRLFWDTLGIGVGLWIVGHLGWAYDDLIRRDPTWLQWHTVFSLCGGIAPLIALLARPHRGTRHHAVTTIGVDLSAFGLFALFVYSYFVLIPSLVPQGRAQAQETLLLLIQLNRSLILIGLLGAVWAARGTDWRRPYSLLAVGAALGFVLRYSASTAIARGDYHPGSIHDLAWIVPWLCYAWAALEAPASPEAEPARDLPDPPTPVAYSVVPVLLVPAVGYGALSLAPLSAPIDSFRALLTGVTTVGGLALLSIRLATQGGALQRTDARLRLLAAATEQTADLILITRADGSVEHANDAFVRALGYSRRELRFLDADSLVAKEGSQLRDRIPRAVREHGIWRGTVQRRRKDGSTFPSACSVAALRHGGAITHYVAVERDIGDELRLRDQLVHSERLSAIGELVAGVAHELNNPLQTIVGCVELMLDDRPGAVNRRDLELVRREAARAGQIVRNLLSFVRRGAPDRAAADLTQIVRATVDLREYHLRQRNITVQAQYAPEPLRVMVNRDEIQQVVLNLLLNAEHAIGATTGAGEITVTTAAEGDACLAEVADTGPGIQPELHGRVFEPFFTTKDVGEGTGLGLSISHGIASAHGGTLELRRSDRGARFRLTLPAYREGAPARGFAGEDAVADASRVLVVDDEPSIRRLLARLLERRGFAVDEAETGEDAVRLAGDHRYSLVVCDVRMPGLSGPELYHLLSSAWPHLARNFIFITGDAGSLDARRDGTGDAIVLAKPFTAADLDAVLGQVQAGR